jgi:hypothetical protein
VTGTPSASNATDSKTVTATCTGGLSALGGGFVITGSADVTASASYPSSATVWTVTAAETDPVSANWSVTAYVICA